MRNSLLARSSDIVMTRQVPFFAFMLLEWRSRIFIRRELINFLESVACQIQTGCCWSVSWHGRDWHVVRPVVLVWSAIEWALRYWAIISCRERPNSIEEWEPALRASAGERGENGVRILTQGVIEATRLRSGDSATSIDERRAYGAFNGMSYFSLSYL
jgi:hypothetical protein